MQCALDAGACQLCNSLGLRCSINLARCGLQGDSKDSRHDATDNHDESCRHELAGSLWQSIRGVWVVCREWTLVSQCCPPTFQRVYMMNVSMSAMTACVAHRAVL